MEEKIENGFAQAIGIGGGVNPFGFPGNQGAPGTERIEGSETLFKNLRWYFISNMRQLLNEMYVEIGLVQTIVDVPIDDGLRGGVMFKSKQLDEGQLEFLQNSLDRDNDLDTAGQAAKWNRLFGGAGILILTDQDPESPIDIDSITPDTPVEFRAADMWELTWDQQNTEGYDPTLQSEDFEHYSYYGERVHKSRVMRLKGLIAPAFLRPRLRGWGFSVVEALVRSINQYLKATDLAFEVLDEFKIDVFKIKNLVSSLMSPNGEEQIRRRVQLANWQKSYQNALTMDSEDDWDHKQLSFAGLGDAMKEIRMQVSADMRMPMLKLFGISSGGLNSSSEDEIEVYNAMVESQVRNKLKYDLLRMAEIKCKKLFGFIPDDLSLEFQPLRVMSSEQEENVKTQKFNRLMQAKQAGELTAKEFREGCNKSEVFDISLDMDDALIQELEDDQAAANPEGSKPPGANKADSETPKPTKNEKKFEESKHPRASDGKFGKTSTTEAGSGDDENSGESNRENDFKSFIEKKESFSEDEQKSLFAYKQDDYKNINSFLRDPADPMETYYAEGREKIRPQTREMKNKIREKVNNISKAFEKSILAKSITVFRGMDNKELATNAENMIGTVFDDFGFMSTTRNKDVTKLFISYARHPVVLQIKVGKGRKAIDLDELVEDMNDKLDYGEKETLLPMQTKLKIISVDRSDKTPVIIVEVVDDE